MNVAILSNSYGEDRSGAIIGREIKRLCPDASVIGAPLISLGNEYKKRGIGVISACTSPPSGGFLLKTPLGLVKDLITSSGVPFSYVARLHIMRDRIDSVIVIGDVILLLLGWFAFRKRMWFLAPCKSDYFSPHLEMEKKIMKKTAIEVFTHDELTAENLQGSGVTAMFLGNPMMDELEKENLYNSPEGKTLMGVLPGSRKEAYKNMKKIGVVIKILRPLYPNLRFAVAVSDTIDKSKLRDSIGDIDAEIEFVKGAFVDIVSSSKLVISLSGTASEQAAGLGVAIITFVGAGPQTTSNRLRGQEKLLGGCLKFVRNFPNGVVDEIINFLSNDGLRKEKGRIGKERMGPKGGARKIAERVLGDRCKVIGVRC
jgi:tetraacyldisaccharide 4'-kinase